MACLHYGNVHICGQTEYASEWERFSEKWPEHCGKGWKVIVYCCNRRIPVEEAKVRWEEAFGGYIADHYYQCADDAGCNVNPNYKRTAHLRDGWYEYD